MPGPLFRRGEAVALHVADEDDHAFVQRNLNDPAVRPGFGAAAPVDADGASGYVSAFAADDDKEIFLVCADGDPVGVAFLFDLDEQRGRAELGYWIDPAHQGNGYATEAAALLVDYCFADRRLHHVVARVLAFNEGSRRVLEKLGFDLAGRLREDFYVDGEYVDADLYDLLAAEWDGVDAVIGGE